MKKKLSTLLKTSIFILTALFIFSKSPLVAEAATQANKNALQKELGDMLYNGDSTTHDVSHYKVSVTELINITNNMKNGEYKWIWAAYYSNMCFNYTAKSSIVQTVDIWNYDSNATTRYITLQKNVDNIYAGLDPAMNDLDKVLYFHNCIVEIASYQYRGYQSFGAGGILGENLGVCSGYTKALNLLLSSEGIECKYVPSDALNHGWTLVKLDGQWYHIDSTWDDTRAKVWSQTGHQYMLCNDSEFKSNGHSTWNDMGSTYASTSTKYSNWFVHNITGKMLFDGGYWYYVDNATNHLMKSKSTGEGMQVVVSGTGKDSFTIVSVENGVVTYTCGGKTYRSDEVEKETIDEAKEETSTDGSTSSTKNNGTTAQASVYWNEFQLWRSGNYNNTKGEYQANGNRICLNDYYEITPCTEYNVVVSETAINMLIRELDENKKIIVSHNLKDSESFTTASNAKYLGISLYPPVAEYSWNYKKYKALFDTGSFSVGLLLGTPLNEDAEASDEDDNATLPDVSNSNSSTIDNSTSTNDTVTIIDKGTYVQELVFWNNFDLWRSGNYNYATGVYQAYSTRICLKDYYEVSPSTKYNIILSDSSTNMLIRELDENKNFIDSYNLKDSASFITASNAKYLGISLYHPVNEYSWTYEKYKTTFSTDGFFVGISYDKIVEDKTNQTNDIATLCWNSFDLWRSGNYYYLTGKYVENNNRICLKEYIDVPANQTYQINISNTELHMLIRELNSSGKLIKSYDLADGQQFTTSSTCNTLGISLYRFQNEHYISLQNYKEMFENSEINIGITPVVNIDDTATPSAASIPNNSNTLIYVLSVLILFFFIIGISLYLKGKNNHSV